MAGRPTVRNEEVNRKIEECAALGASIEEIALYCGVWRSTLYRWMEEDEELKDRIHELQERPILKARQTIIKGLDDPDNAKWYLERKKKSEFSPKQENEFSGGITINSVHYASDDSVQLPTETLSAPILKGDGQREEQGDTDMAPEIG